MGTLCPPGTRITGYCKSVGLTRDVLNIAVKGGVRESIQNVVDCILIIGRETVRPVFCRDRRDRRIQ